jgi:glyoxylase-like metal-dependent hydrolase (beta-lactamase superfamily II)
MAKKRIFLIDNGVASSEKIILDYLKSTARQPEDISQLILTHSHPDHIGAARAIKSISGSTLAAHAAEKSWIEDVGLQGRERPVPGFKSLVAGSVHVDQTLQDGDVLDLDGLVVSGTWAEEAQSMSPFALMCWVRWCKREFPSSISPRPLPGLRTNSPPTEPY